jgi:hypothetical protein
MKEQNDIADKQTGHFAVLHDLDVSPQDLIRQPASEPKAHQGPEEPSPTRGPHQIVDAQN